MQELAFVLAPQQNHFFVELVAALRDEVESLGLTATVHEGAFPPPRPGRVYALVPPHEYFTLMDGRVGPPPSVLARTIFVCAEQPDTSFFESNVDLARRGGAVFDINRLAVAEFTRRGIAAEHLQLGWTPRWAHLGERERDIDVLFMGCATDRRLRHLGRYARELRHRRLHYVISDNSRPNWAPSGTFVTDDDKWDLLGRSKVLVNLHQEHIPYFEWLRVVQTVANGCAIVSEHSLDVAPLRPNEHLLTGRPESLGLLAEHLLVDDARRHALATAAWHELHDHHPLRAGAAGLVAAVQRLDEQPVPDGGEPFYLQPPPPAEPAARFTTGFVPPPPETASVRRAIKEVKLDVMDIRRGLARLALERAGGPVPGVVVDRRTPAHPGAHPRVSVLVTVFNYENEIAGALSSVTRSHERAWELVIVDDGSDDGSLDAVRRWMDAHPLAPAVLVRHPVNRGLGPARNTALAFARAPFAFVLDADNEIFPKCLGTLLAALDADPEAAFAYGVHERFGRDRTIGLANWVPWEPWRFRSGNFIDAMALIRTDVLRRLGGYGTDRRLYGWEDFDLWCRIAEAGGHGAFVADVVARYRSTDHSMITTTNISPDEVLSLIAERSPTVMGERG